MLQLGKRSVVFYDYRAKNIRYKSVATIDWTQWQDISSEISLPKDCKHGSFLHITEVEATRLLTRHDPPANP